MFVDHSPRAKFRMQKEESIMTYSPLCREKYRKYARQSRYCKKLLHMYFATHLLQTFIQMGRFAYSTDMLGHALFYYANLYQRHEQFLRDQVRKFQLKEKIDFDRYHFWAQGLTLRFRHVKEVLCFFICIDCEERKTQFNKLSHQKSAGISLGCRSEEARLPVFANTTDPVQQKKRDEARYPNDYFLCHTIALAQFERYYFLLTYTIWN